MAPHYDPIHEQMDDGNTFTVDDLVDQYNRETSLDAEEVNPSQIQANIASALSALGPETFDDNAKWEAVISLIDAMVAVDQLENVDTTFEVETVEEEVNFAGETQLVPVEKINTQSVPKSQ